MFPVNYEVRHVSIFHTTKHEASFALLDFFLNVPVMDSTVYISPSPNQKMCWSTPFHSPKMLNS